MEMAGQFSPDGRWLAYESDESGVSEIHIKPLLFEGRPRQVSSDGGTRPRWRADGRLMTVPIALDSVGRGIDVGAPTSLFATRPAYITNTGMAVPNYAVAPDGQRFLMNVIAEESGSTPHYHRSKLAGTTERVATVAVVR
jgi:hypothetical protein